MLSDDERMNAAQALFEAEHDRLAIPQLSKTYPNIELQDAYEIQRRWAGLHMDMGRKHIGHKIGLTSRAMQKASRITEPDYGHLLDNMLYRDGDRIDASLFMNPRLEVELAFIMETDLEGPGMQVHDILRATEYIVPALEIIDYRTEVPRAITDTIADNAASGGFVMGGRPIRPFDVDLRWVGGLLVKNGVIEESGVSAAIMGHPAAGVAWLANKLSAVGSKLAKGQIVLAGSFTRPIDVAAGDVIQVDYGQLGGIGVSFA